MFRGISGSRWAFPEHLRIRKVLLSIMCVPLTTTPSSVRHPHYTGEGSEAASSRCVRAWKWQSQDMHPVVSGSLDRALSPALEMLESLSPQGQEPPEPQLGRQPCRNPTRGFGTFPWSLSLSPEMPEISLPPTLLLWGSHLSSTPVSGPSPLSGMVERGA